MKTLIALSLLTLSLSSFGTEIFGGTLTSMDKEYGNHTLALECVSYDRDGDCETFQALENEKWLNGDEFKVVGRPFSKDDLKEIAKRANKIMQRRITSGYALAAIYGTAIGAVLAREGGIVVAVPVGMGIDIVKAPVVGAAFIGAEVTHGAFGLLNMESMLKALTSKKKQGDDRRVTKAHLNVLLQAINERE